MLGDNGNMSPGNGLSESPFGLIPDEILELILSCLDGPALSETRQSEQPFYGLTVSNEAPLKQASCVSARWRRIARPFLFRYTHLLFKCDDGKSSVGERADQIQRFLGFVQEQGPSLSVESLTVEFQGSEQGNADSCCDRIYEGPRNIVSLVETPFFNPARFTLVAPPHVLGKLTDCPVLDGDRFSFHMPYHLLSLAQPPPNACVSKPSTSEQRLLRAGPWTSAFLNEGSFNRAHGEYNTSTPRRPPSILPVMMRSDASHHASLMDQGLDPALRHLTYVAINPTATHLEMVFAYALARLESVAVRVSAGQGGVCDDQWQGAWFDARFYAEAQTDHILEAIMRLRRVPRKSQLRRVELQQFSQDLTEVWPRLEQPVSPQGVGSDLLIKDVTWKAESPSVMVRV